MQRRVRSLALAGFIVVSFCAGQASAQNVAGAVQLGLGTDIVSYSNNTLEVDAPTGDLETETSTTEWGITGESGVSFEVGYGASEAIVAGAFLLLGGSSTETEGELGEEGEESEMTIGVGPKVDFMLSQGSSARPFVSALAGFLHTSSESAANVEIGASGFVIGGRVGVRWFAAPGFSVDPQVGVNYLSVSGEAEPDIGDAVDVSASGYGISLGVAFSGWLL